MRQAAAEDVEAIATIEHITRGGDVGEWAERLNADLQHPARWLFAASLIESVIGFGRVALLDEAGDGPGGFYLGGVTVDPAHRRAGVGTRLTTHRLAWIWERADVAWCVVNARNTASLVMHEHLGFIEVMQSSRISGVEFTGGVGKLLRAERPGRAHLRRHLVGHLIARTGNGADETRRHTVALIRPRALEEPTMSEQPSPSGKLIVSRDGPVTTITLNRPEVHNALDREVSAELNAVVKEIDVDRECRIVVLRGAGETFCAGDDIKEFNTWRREDTLWQVRQYQETVNIVDNLVPVTIAAVDGVCTGGGLELTLACDFVVATHRSRWGMPEINWAITPGWGGTGRLSKFAGRRKAKEWNLLGALFTAETAERHDLVNRLCEPEALDSEVASLIEVLLDKSPASLLCTKYFVDKGADLDMWSSLFFEGAPPREPFGAGVREFVDKDTRDARRRLTLGFWQD